MSRSRRSRRRSPVGLSVATFGGIAPGTPQFTDAPADCPPDSKIGTVRIDTPSVIDHPLEGSVFLATPNDNPFDSVLALYLAVDDPASGIVLKLPMKLEGDPADRTAHRDPLRSARSCPSKTCSSNSSRAPAAPLKTGIACGTFTVHSPT